MPSAFIPAGLGYCAISLFNYSKALNHSQSVIHRLSDSNGNRTRVTAVKGRCLNRLTMEPHSPSRLTPRVGLEPTTTRLTAECSTIELSRKVKGLYLQNRTPKQIPDFRLLSWLSFRPISKCQLNTLLCLHLTPIYLVVFKGSYWISHLEGGFTLRCLQRLSLPDLATAPYRYLIIAKL